MSFWEWAVYVISLRCQIFAGRDRVHDVRRGPRRRARPPARGGGMCGCGCGCALG